MSKKKYRILHIDDEADMHRLMSNSFEDFDFLPARDAYGLKQIIKKKEQVDLVLLDLVLDDSKPKDLSGLMLIDDIKKAWKSVNIIAITKEPSAATIALNKGANHFLHKNEFDLDLWEAQFLQAIRDKLEKEKLESQLEEQGKFINPINFPFIGNSEEVQKLKERLKAGAETDISVMLNGETGVGKGVSARFFHANSPTRRNKPFIEINISAIPKDLVPSQLFGHLKGSFTGAHDDQKGRLELANQGIVFLDEIGDLDLENQVKILNFLQDKTITPLGAKEPIILDVQILAATNKDLVELVKNGAFREDLFHRLRVFTIQIPPLRDRREDILPLLAYFMKCTEVEALIQIEENALNFLINQCSWTGNVRQLENAVQSMLIEQKIARLQRISMSCLPSDLFDHNIRVTPVETHFERANLPVRPSNSNGQIFDSFDEEIAYRKLQEIEKALILKNKKKKDVAGMLGYKTDDNLRYAIKKHLTDYPQFAKKFEMIQDAYHKLIKDLNIK